MTTIPTKKVIYLQTNHNKKLECDYFLHIALAPAGGIPESEMEKTIVEIRTRDNSYPPVTGKLDDLCRLKLKDIRSLITWQSHGMDAVSFQEWLLKQKPGISKETEIAVYFYKKVG